jgi:hypothetical protein
MAISACFLQVLHSTRIDHFFHNKHELVFIPLPLSALLFLVYCLLWFCGSIEGRASAGASASGALSVD